MHRRIALLRLRITCVLACLAALPLYATEEAISRLLGRPWIMPGRLVDRIDHRLSDLEDRVTAADDERFGKRLGAWTERACDAIDTALTYITGRA
ncbi:hypothetical protein LIX60_25370 [Streptomyces sp. S07_1.15]|uniref:hypothetical protein n=1 Tax=Streptomyces sp. S07_1.15 TaxID=2873925 RepID=UPI001D136DF2|nr:hypothetical protein [Streptomyces sp. S07_1.15]MCC3654734.1 hypothetical protein [Streptomyces sp. S07_1.15]